MTKPRQVLVGAVNYLNAKPLVYELDERCASVRVTYDLPSRLADRLAQGQLDVALIPSIEFFQDPTYRVVSDACIACRGPAMSVKLFSRVPIRQIRTLALDEGSRTSAALARILLARQYGVRPDLERLPIGRGLADCRTDAVMLIGDRAIPCPNSRFEVVWDLGDRWWRETGLPLVFAMWVARAGVETAGLAEALGAARDRGVADIERIAEAEAGPLGLTRPDCVAYLRDHLHFVLGRKESRGLNLLRQWAVELGLAPHADREEDGAVPTTENTARVRGS